MISLNYSNIILKYENCFVEETLKIIIFDVCKIMAKMIDSIDIRKYRNLDELRINSLARVNLIIGKNNSGKSTLLEAIALFATKCNLGIIFQILEERGEFFSRIPNNKNATEANVKSLSSLFTNRNIGYERSDAITIGTIENNLFGDLNPVG